MIIQLKKILKEANFVLLAGNLHTVKLYKSLYDRPLRKTILICPKEIKNSEMDEFLHVLYITKLPKNLILKVLLYIRYRFISLFIKREFNKIELKYFGIDHAFFSDFFNGHEYILIEDGLLNYTYNTKKNNALYGFFLNKKKTYGRSNKCVKIYLTGIKDTPHEISNKVEMLSISEKKELSVVIMY